MKWYLQLIAFGAGLALIQAVRPWGFATPLLGLLLIAGYVAGTIRNSPRR